MKRLITILLCSLYFALSHSQIQYSVEGGLNANMFKIDQEGSKNKSLLHEGYYFAMNFGSKVKENTEWFDLWGFGAIALDRKGGKEEIKSFNQQPFEGYKAFNLYYISIPAYLQPRLHINTDAYISMKIGGHLSQLIYAQKVYSGNYNTPANKKRVNESQEINVGYSRNDLLLPFDYGAILGLGVGWNDFELNVTYKPHFFDISLISNYYQYNSSVTFSLCYHLAYM